MSTALSQTGEPATEFELAARLMRIRGHAALLRALLDELERVAPLPTPSPDVVRVASLSEQLAEETGRLGRRLLDCAAALIESVGVAKPTVQLSLL
jgi:hypothetical protein